MAEPTLNLAGIMDASQKFLTSLNSKTGQIQDAYGTAAATSKANAELYQSIGQSETVIDSVKQNAELATQQAKIKVANSLGTNAKDQSEILTQLSDVIATEYAKKDLALQEIEAKKSVGLFDDPLSWIVNQFTINDDIDRHNAANARLKSAEDQMQTINQLTQSSNLTQSQLTESISATTIAASSKKIAAQAQIFSNNETAKGALYNVEGIKAALGADKEALGVKFNVYGAQKQEQQLQIAFAHLDLDRQRFDWQKEEKKAADAAKNVGKEVDQYLLDNINAGMKQAQGDGANLLVSGSVRANSVIAAIKSNSPLGKEFQDYYKIGERNLTLGVKVLGTSPANSLEVLSTIPVKLVPAQLPVKSLMEQAARNVGEAVKTGTLDGKNRAAIDAALNQEAARLVEAQAKNVKPGDRDNIFNIPDLKDLISQSPTLQKLPVVQKVLAPVITSGADLSDPNKAFGLVAKALQDGKITSAEAADFATVYQTGVTTNLAARQLNAFGIQFPEKSKFNRSSYNTAIETKPGAYFGGTQTVDLTKPEEVSRALNKYLANKIDYSGLGSN